MDLLIPLTLIVFHGNEGIWNRVTKTVARDWFCFHSAILPAWVCTLRPDSHFDGKTEKRKPIAVRSNSSRRYISLVCFCLSASSDWLPLSCESGLRIRSQWCEIGAMRNWKNVYYWLWLHSADSVLLKCVFLCPMERNFWNAQLALTKIHESLPVDYFY